MGYRSNLTGSSSFCGNGGMEQGGIKFGIPVEWDKELFRVVYRWN